MDKEVLLKTEVQEFINSHLNDDIPSLILKKTKYPNYPIIEIAEQIISKRKASKKLPTWYSTEHIIYPSAVSIEQSSSEITAQYKANLLSGNSILDLTGGLGVDSYYFSKSFEKADYVEANAELVSIAAHNFNVLKARNIKTYSLPAEDFIDEEGLSYDLIYVDPDRRPKKTRVYGFDDSTPNLLEILPRLKAISDNILIKASPMMDISLAKKQLGAVYKIIILAVDNEVKELLFWINQKSASKEITKCVNIIGSKEDCFEIILSHEAQEECLLGDIGTYLFEPNAAIMKSGAFGALCKRYDLTKVNRNTNLFTSEEINDSFPGRIFRVICDTPYKKSKILPFLVNKKANVSVRNFIDTPDELKKKIGLKDGGEHYIFGYRNINNQQRVAICTKVPI